MEHINRAPAVGRGMAACALRAASQLALILALSACGGGGGGGTPPADANVTGNDPGGNTPVDENAPANPGFSGRVYYDSAYGASILDLESGRVTLFSELSGLNPSVTGAEMVDAMRKPGDDDVDQMRIRNEDGYTTTMFEVSKSLSGPKLSPDGQTIAAWWSNEAVAGEFADDVLTLFSRTGRVINRLTNATRFTWMPDGRLMYAVGVNLYVADQTGNGGVLLKTLPDTVLSMAVSPDGKHVAIQILGANTSVQESHVWFMNMDGTGLRQMTRSYFNETDPVWVGDGSWLMVREGVLPHITGYSGCPNIYMVPADADMVELTEARPTRARQIKYREFNKTGLYSVCPFSTIAWAPVSPNLPSAGSLPAVNGLPNRGLSGRLVYQSGYRSLKSARNWLLDMQSGARVELTTLIDGFDASTDGLWLASTGLIETDSHGWTSELALRDLQGQLVKRFEKEGELVGPVRFSPDNKRLLFIWQTRSADSYAWTDHLVVTDLAGTIQLGLDGYQSGDWLADGGLVVSDETGIYKIDPAFSKVTRILSATDGATRLRVSPDSQWVAFTMLDRVWVARTDGTASLRRLTQSDGRETAPDWSPDGRYVAVAYQQDTSTSAYWTYAWVVAADARGVTVGQVGLEQQAFAVRGNDAGELKTTDMTTRFSWR